MVGSYSFGDTSLAQRRLDLLAETFAPATAAFLRARGPRAPRSAVDLGCGPGHTSLLLGATHVVGIDSSESYVAAARARGVEARAADVTGALPELAGAELVFARFLLTHLADPRVAVAGWLSQMSSGATLLLEEVEGIDCDVPALSRYLALQRAMLAERGHELDVGARLDAIARELRPGAVSEVATLDVAAEVAARMFAMNFAVWGDDPEVAASLEAVDPGAPSLRWRLRHVVLVA